MFRTWLALAVLFACAAWGQAPSYTAASIVNASNFAPGPFAANSVLSLFGTNLSFDTLNADLSAGDSLPTQLAGVSVFVNGSVTPLLFVSPGQINFLFPVTAALGDTPVTVVRNGNNGPTVTVTVVAAAPQLFTDSTGFAIAEDWNTGYAQITASAPAQPGDIVILFATGLGAVMPKAITGQAATTASPISGSGALTVTLNGTALDPSAVLYAGLSPGSVGLYQINVVLPPNPGTNPQVQVSLGGQTSAAGCQLSVN